MNLPTSVDGVHEEIMQCVERCHSAIRVFLPPAERPAMLYAVSDLLTLPYHLLTGNLVKARLVLDDCLERTKEASPSPEITETLQRLFEALEASIAARFPAIANLPTASSLTRHDQES